MHYLGAIIGSFAGFALGLVALKHITKGHAVQKLLENKEAKFWLGLFGWFCAFVGAYLGYTLAR